LSTVSMNWEIQLVVRHRSREIGARRHLCQCRRGMLMISSSPLPYLIFSNGASNTEEVLAREKEAPRSCFGLWGSCWIEGFLTCLTRSMPERDILRAVHLISEKVSRSTARSGDTLGSSTNYSQKAPSRPWRRLTFQCAPLLAGVDEGCDVVQAAATSRSSRP